MAVQKLTPRYLNKDNDERLIKSEEMTDALNIRISTDDDGDALVLKNAYGNTAVDLDKSLPAGTNKVIGSVSDEQLGYIFYFVWNSNEDHSIYRYSVGANQAQRIIKDSVLEFTENGFVKGDVYVNINGDVLLYFNDGRTAPKKINTTKALINDYPQLLTGTDDEKLSVLTVIKRPPLDPPAYNIVNNPDVRDNNIKDKVFQFAYKYVYNDGEHSAISPYSSLTVSQNQLRRGFTTLGQDNFFNQINIYPKYSSADVKKIVLYYREGNEGAFYEFEEINNVVGSGSATVKFTNSKQGAALPSNEQNKLFDNVPQVADSQEIINGRLMYGGYTESYPNIDTDVELIPNYHGTQKIYNASVDTTSTVNDGYLKLGIGYGDMPAVFSEDAIVYVNLVLSGDTIVFGGNDPTKKLDFDTFTITFSDNDGTNIETYGITKTEEPIPFIPTGIKISESIQVSANSTRDQAITDLVNAIASKNYDTALAPTNDQNIALNNIGTNFTDETAVFYGRAVFDPVASTNYEVSFNPSILELYVSEFYKGSTKKEVISVGQIQVDANSYTLTYQLNSPYHSGYVMASEGKETSTKSFKSGSYHKMGLVYYDENNRSGGVQELGEFFTDSLKDRSNENDLYGHISLTMRINHSAPSWAKRWAPVYSGRGRSELKLQTGVSGAYLPFRLASDIQSISNRNVIYVSLNSLFAKSVGYNDSTGANISYSYSEGDKLRILYYGSNSHTPYEFNVIGYEILEDNDSNPILDKSSSTSIHNTTGHFLLIEENKSATGFNYNNLVNRDSNWFTDCIVEVYNNRADVGEIYYEIGKSYEVSNSIHSDERTSSTLDIDITSSSNGDLEGNTTTRIFKGDLLSVGSNTISIGNVYKKGSNYYFYATDNSSTPLAVNTYSSVTVSSTEKVIDINLGDVYFRRRELKTTARNSTFSGGERKYPPLSSIIHYIEDYSVSDFFDSKSTSIGRPISYIPDVETIKRKASITYSDFDSEDSFRLNLSSFNLSLSNFKDLAYEHGSIKYLVGYNEVLYFIQEKRTGKAGVGRQVVQTGSGNDLVTLSTNVIGNERYYVGEYGVGDNPESVAFKDGMVYFADVNANKVLRIDSQGLTVISDTGMESYFEDKFSSISKYQSHLVGGGIDDDNSHYVIHSGDISTSQVLINTDEYSYDVSLDSTGTQVSAPVQYNPSAVFNISTEPRTFNEICDEFDGGISAVVYLDQLSSGGSVYTNLPYQASNVLGVATNSSFDFFVMIRLNMYVPSFIFDNGYCNSDDTGSIDPSSSTVPAFTTAYDTSSRRWSTRYSFAPERVDSLHSLMYTFKNGRIYRHDSSADRNTFYGGSTADSIVEAVSNIEPSSIKTFESLSLEGNSPWSLEISNESQSTSIAESSFSEKEGFYYSYIHGATSSYGSTISSVSSTSEIFPLGEVSAVSGATVTLKNRLSTSFPLGSTATLYKVGSIDLASLSVTPVSIDSSTSVTFSGNVTATAGDLLVVVGDSAIEGDQIRGYYGKIKLTKNSSEPIELYAINAIVADSKAHN